MHGLPLRKSAPPGSTPAPIRRWATDAADESALKVPLLQAEILGLRQKLAEVQAKRESLLQEIDDLRRDRDHWQKLAKSAAHEKAGTRAWFCGRVSSGN
jgi:hypothetical protein